jgi:hypothetical protein
MYGYDESAFQAYIHVGMHSCANKDKSFENGIHVKYINVAQQTNPLILT